MIVSPFKQALLAVVRRRGPISRQDLAQHLHARPNSVGDAAARLIRRGLLREEPPRINGPGRPSVPLAVDPRRRVVLGLALEPGRVGCSRLNLLGQPVAEPIRRRVASPARLIHAAARLLRDARDRRVLAVGVSTTGFVDVDTRRVLLSSAVPDAKIATLDPVFAAAGRTPVVLDNDMHALAAAWLLSEPRPAEADVLLVDLRDGGIGGALIVAGRPNRGCVVGGNEIGHTRCPAVTPVCYCGQSGCIERVFSSEYLGTRPGHADDLAARLRRGPDADAALADVLGHLAWVFANAVNLIRPTRLVLHLPTGTHADVVHMVEQHTRRQLLRPLADRVRIEQWTGGPDRFSESAAWLALAGLYLAAWPQPAQ